MVVCVNVYQVKTGQTDTLTEELRNNKIEETLRGLPGNIYFNFSVPIQDKDVLYLADAWEDEAAFQAHLTHPATLQWLELKKKYVDDTQINRYDV